MDNRSASLFLHALAAGEAVVSHALLAALPAGDGPPDWITLFPRIGKVETRDGRIYDVDAAALLAAFDTDGLQIPVDVNHATDTAAFTGGRSDAVGWITGLRERGGAVEGRVDWLDEGRALLAGKRYRYLSPSFWTDAGGRTTRLRAVALVTAPALARQPALAAADPTRITETSMKGIATALGLAETASEAECLAAIGTLKADEDGRGRPVADAVPKAVHEQALANLAATTKQLDELRAGQRKARVDALIEGALKQKKIVPAQRDHYAALCSTDEGLAQIEKLIAASPELLAASGLDGKRPDDGGALDAEQLLAKASARIEEAAKAGRTLRLSDAVTAVKEGL